MHAILGTVIAGVLYAFERGITVNIRLKKALNDLWINPGRTAIIYFALVIGLWGVGSVIVSYRILSRDLTANFRMTLPAHAVVTSGDFDRLDLSALRQRPGIERAEFRDLSTLRIESRPGEWIPLWLFGVEDFNSFDLARLFGQGGGASDPAAPGEGEMVIERDGLKFTDLKAGLSARIRSGDRIVQVPVAGIVFDPAQAPGTMDHLIYGYVSRKTFSGITGEAVDRRLIVRFNEVTSNADVQAAADDLADYLGSSGVVAREVTIPKFNEHPHQWQLNTLLFLEGAIGFLAFFMGLVLVSQLMAAILASQIRQIGILKAMGATRFKVLQIYLAMVLALGVLSSTVAVPLAVKSGYAYANFVSDILNFEVLTRTLPFSFYVAIIAIGVLLPVLLSLPALLKGTRISVLNALNDYGIGREAGPSGKVVGRLPVPGWLALAFRNTLRRKGRLAVTVATMALGVGIFYTGFNIQQSLKSWLAGVSSSMKHDVQVVLSEQLPAEEALKYFEGLDNVGRIETWNGGRGAMQSGIVATDEGVGIVALPRSTDLVAFESIEGRWLKDSPEPEIVMNREAAAFYGGGEVGSYQTIRVKGRELRAKLVGIVDELDAAKVYMDEGLYDGIANPGHRINSLMFVARDKRYDKVLDLKRDIEQAIESSDLKIHSVTMQAEWMKIIYDHLYVILVSIVFLAMLVLVVSAMGMASATSINIMERTREIGVLRAIGATPGIIERLFVSEGMIVSAVSIVIGLLLSWPLSIAASRFFGNLILDAPLRLVFSHPGFVITLIATIAFGWLASRIPARKAVKVSTREALSYE
jgi:putative ABC transport system permease protein